MRIATYRDRYPSHLHSEDLKMQGVIGSTEFLAW